MRDCRPFLFGYVEGVIILGDGFVVPSIDDDFVTVGDHVVEGTAIWQGFFCLCAGELNVDLCQRVVKLTPAVALIGILRTSEDVDVVTYAAHRMALHPTIRQLKLAGYCFPLEVSR